MAEWSPRPGSHILHAWASGRSLCGRARGKMVYEVISLILIVVLLARPGRVRPHPCRGMTRGLLHRDPTRATALARLGVMQIIDECSGYGGALRACWSLQFFATNWLSPLCDGFCFRCSTPCAGSSAFKKFLFSQKTRRNKRTRFFRPAADRERGVVQGHADVSGIGRGGVEINQELTRCQSRSAPITAAVQIWKPYSARIPGVVKLVFCCLNGTFSTGPCSPYGSELKTSPLPGGEGFEVERAHPASIRTLVGDRHPTYWTHG